MSNPGARFRELLAQPGCAMAVGAYDPSVAKLVERAGFPMVYVSGSGSATAVNGFTDAGLISFKEMLDNARNIVAATSLPTLCDIDTGNGNVINVMRTIREYEQIGAAGVHLEDQTFPKRCGQTAGAELIDVGEMCAKIYAAKEAQQGDDFVLIVRTDARQVEGLDAVIERSRAYLAAGCDAIFPEALLEADEFRRVREALPDASLAIDVPEWGRSPTMTVAELAEWGFDLGIFALSAMRVALASVRSFLADLHVEETQLGWIDRMMPRADVDELVGLPQIRDDEERLLELGRRVVASRY
ncbi:MAG TPA: isocitrate lyase/phosphoenolpyruvate mutase family protein [Solirubrobacteraceae bacterium]|nr:isocitrate lyase/phosphoenolpyruvate mutase family protein [Solirubrobacteraceae bacterium]